MTTYTYALGGSGIDGSWFLDTTDFARDTSRLNGLMFAYTSDGIGLFAIFILAAWWVARRADAATMTAALAVPATTAVAAYLINDGVKWVVAEPRPCFTYPQAFLLEKCSPATDYAFPSNHVVVAAAMTAALLLISRRLGILAARDAGRDAAAAEH